jgi:hypothetical protein
VRKPAKPDLRCGKPRRGFSCPPPRLGWLNIGGVGLLGALGGLPTGGLFGGIGRMINNGTWSGGSGNGNGNGNT